MFNVKVWVSFNYGGWSLVFSKDVPLPFAPFYGLQLVINEAEDEAIVELNNNDYCRTCIAWNVDTYEFDIDVRNLWKQPVSDETIDAILKTYATWSRQDNTNIEALKELMRK